MIYADVIPSHSFAIWALDLINRLLSAFDLSPKKHILAGEVLYSAVVILVAAAIG